MNAREFFLNFIPLRTGLGAFHEIRLIAWLMFDTLVDKFPITQGGFGKTCQGYTQTTAAVSRS